MSPFDDDLTSSGEPGANARSPGVVAAIVTENRDPDGLGRVKLRYPWSEATFQSDWARVASPMGGAAFGTFSLPEVGDEVLVAFDRGDARHPYVLGGLWKGTREPASPDDGDRNGIRLIQGREGHRLQFDDGVEGRLVIELQGGKSITIEDGGILIDDGVNKVKLDTAAGAVTIEAGESLTLKAPRISIEGGVSTEIEAGRMLTAKAALVAIN